MDPKLATTTTCQVLTLLRLNQKHNVSLNNGNTDFNTQPWKKHSVPVMVWRGGEKKGYQGFGMHL